MRALYEIELMWGSGVMDLGKIKGILTGRDTTKCTGHDTPNTAEHLGTSVKI
jgi:hypothetical protein